MNESDVALNFFYVCSNCNTHHAHDNQCIPLNTHWYTLRGWPLNIQGGAMVIFKKNKITWFFSEQNKMFLMAREKINIIHYLALTCTTRKKK